MVVEVRGFARDLNKDFFEHARIKNLVSILYYPAQKILKGHAELEIEGRAYTLGCWMQVEHSLEKKIRKAINGKLPFYRTSILVTPEQLVHIKKLLELPLYPEDHILHLIQYNPNAFGITCMHGVSKILQKAKVMNIPPIINLSPLLSYFYLNVLKKLGSDRIQKLEFFGNAFANFRNLAFITSSVACEVFSLYLGTYGVFKALSSLYKFI